MRLPIGISDFREIIENGYEFVDKSLFIQDVIEDTKVILITRPRRFGKTLQLSMLKYFFSNDENKASNKSLFKDLKISRSSKKILEHQGKYPVIFLTLKDIKATHFDNIYNSFCVKIKDLYLEHSHLLDSPKLHAEEKAIYETILKQEASLVNMEDSLKALTRYLSKHYGVNPVVLIDEYDTPIQQGRSFGFYEEVIRFFRNVLGAVLKDNSYLHQAVLTGILRISKESLFSDLNNIEVYTLLRSAYGAYFGFTQDEVNVLLTKANLQTKSEEIKNWYNGYQMGEHIMYNPWSIISCIKQEGELQPYWVNTSDNTLIKDLILSSSFDFKSQFELLLQDIPIETIINDHIVFQYLNSNETAVWTLFLMAGYLKVVSRKLTDQGLWCQIAIPNREVRNLYRVIIESWLSDGRAINWYNQFLHELLNGSIDKVQKYLSDILLQIASVYDMAREPEAFYHGLMLGLTASVHNDYEIKSNRESGFGLFDIVVIPKDIQKLGIVIELKVSEDGNLEKTADLALKQIEERKYSTELTARGIHNILNMGISFSGKKLYIASRRES